MAGKLNILIFVMFRTRQSDKHQQTIGRAGPIYAIANASNCIVYAAVAGPGLALTPTPHVQERK